MNFKKVVARLTLLLLLGSGMSVAADFNKGLAAAQSGDFKTALTEWIPLAEQGDVSAQHNLGLMYDNGTGVPANDKTAVKWYTKAAEQGYANAQHSLGNMYDLGKGVPENDKTAVRWYTLAAKQGNAKGQVALGMMNYFGYGVLTSYLRAYMWTSLSSYNGLNVSKPMEFVTEKLTSAQIVKAQEMSSRCLESGYTDC